MARSPVILEKRDSSKRIGALAALWPFMRPYRRMVIGAGLALISTAVISLILPIAVRRVVDNFNTGSAALLDSYFGAALVIATLVTAMPRLSRPS